jgi:hypothetical protein
MGVFNGSSARCSRYSRMKAYDKSLRAHEAIRFENIDQRIDVRTMHVRETRAREYTRASLVGNRDSVYCSLQ